MRMNVLFVNPGRFYMVKAPQSVDTIYFANRFPPLGLLYIATAVKNKTQHKVEFFDFDLGATSYDDIVPLLQRFRPDVVGITAYTFTLYDAYEACKVIKRYAPEAKIVLGGPHVEAYPEETFAQPFIDIAARGEGDETMLDILEHYEGKRELKDIAGIYYRDAASGQVHFTGDREKIDDMDSIAFPDRTMLPDLEYYSVLNPKLVETSMISSRGCPHKCTFCYTRAQKYRYRSPDNILDEMDVCVRQGYNCIQFQDDTMNLFGKKMKDFCRRKIERGQNVRWVFRGRVDQVDEEMGELLRQSNCIRVYFGVESGNEDVLASTLKAVTLDQVRNAFRIMKRNKIETVAYFMIGFPDETPAQMEETIDFAREVDPTYVQATITIPYPGTPLYRQALAEKGIPGDYFRDYALNPTPVMRGLPWNRYLSETELNGMLRRFYRRFYFRPRYMMRRAAELRNPVEVFRKVGAVRDLVRFLRTTAPSGPAGTGKANEAAAPPVVPALLAPISPLDANATTTKPAFIALNTIKQPRSAVG